MADLRGEKITEEEKHTFIEYFRKTANFSLAAKATGRSARAFIYLRQRDKEFRDDLEAALLEGAIYQADAAAWDRALNGYEETYVSKDGKVTTARKHDNKLLMFMLERRLRAEYGPVSRVEMTGKDGGPIKSEDASPRDELAKKLRGIAERLEKKNKKDDDGNSGSPATVIPLPLDKAG